MITDKATAEIPSPYAGVVARIHVPAGELAAVGAVLVTIGEPDAVASSPSQDQARPRPPERRPSATIADPGSPGGDGGAPEAKARASNSSNSSNSSNAEVRAMPPVRKLARDLGVDLGAVQATGPNGRIRRGDVEAFASGAGVGASKDRGAARRVPLRGIRRTIAQRMTQAHLTVPPVTHVEECDVTELDATRSLANERNPGATRLTYLPFIVKAVVAALKSHEAMNASLDEAAGEILLHDRYHIGIAVDTPGGLAVPVIRDADTKRLMDIAADIERLATAARAGGLMAGDLRDATFTVTSPGPFGGLMATPIVFHPQSAILGVHRATDRPVVRDGQIVVRKIMNLSVTFDHRILDGMTAAKFALDVVELLEHPAVLALES